MARDVSAYLQDVLEACSAIEDVMSGVAVFGLVYSDLIVLKAEVGELLHDSHDAN